MLTRYFAACEEIIGRYGGTVEKFIGDAVMAVWGVPTTHEDDAERAVRAALDLVATVGAMTDAGANLALRAAVLTGDAAATVGAQGNPWLPATSSTPPRASRARHRPDRSWSGRPPGARPTRPSPTKRPASNC